MVPSASPSEFAVFQKLANPAKTDFSRRRAPSVASFGADVSIAARTRRSVVPVAAPAPVPVPVPAPVAVAADARSSASRKSGYEPPNRLTSTKEEEEEVEAKVEAEVEAESDDDNVVDNEEYRFEKVVDPDRRGKGVGLPSGFKTCPVPVPVQFYEPEANVLPEVLRSLQAEIDKEKQGFLLELSKFKHGQGITLTREYTMADSLEEIQFEYDEIRRNLDTRNTVGFIRDTMFLGFQGVELANSKWGPVLQLDGWAKSTMKDKQRYDHALERLYKQHWRKGNMSPSSELGWLIGSSMLMRHFKNKWGKRDESDSDSEGGDEPPVVSKKGKSNKGKVGGGPMDLSGMMSGMMGSMMGGGGLAGALGGLGGLVGGGLPPVHASSGNGGGSMRGPVVNANLGMPIMRPPTTNGLCGSVNEPPVVPIPAAMSTINMQQRLQPRPAGWSGGRVGPNASDATQPTSASVSASPHFLEGGDVDMAQSLLKAKDQELMQLRAQMEKQNMMLSSSLYEMQNKIRQHEEHDQRRYQQQERETHQEQLESQRRRQHQDHVKRGSSVQQQQQQHQQQQHQQHQQQQHQQQQHQQHQQHFRQVAVESVARVHFASIPLLVSPGPISPESRFENVDSDSEECVGVVGQSSSGESVVGRDVEKAQQNASLDQKASDVKLGGGGMSRIPREMGDIGSVMGTASPSAVTMLSHADSGNEDERSDDDGVNVNSDSDGDRIRHIVLTGGRGSGGTLKKNKASIVLNV